ncbi:MAG: HD domain-containing protein [Chloroflexi bacterium]|nr:HD domain-containing protein [Chloroflexota bacterium]
MRRVFVNNVTPGMKLGQSIYGHRGELLLAAGVALSPQHLRLLRERGYYLIFAEDGRTDDIEIPEIISDQVRSTGLRVVQDMQSFLERAAETVPRSSVSAAKRGMDGAAFARATRDKRPLVELSQAATAIVSEILDRDARLGIDAIRLHDEGTFGHSVGVAVAGVVIGKQLRLSRDALCVLATGCLLHDIGKIFVAPEVLNKPGKLTEDEMAMVRQHPALGYQAAKQLFGPGIISNHIPYQHHERQDGTGYPRGLVGSNRVPRPGTRRSGGEILPLAEVASIADVYDALSSHRPYRPALPPDQVIQILQQSAGASLNAGIMDSFLGVLALYPVGEEVVLRRQKGESLVGVVIRQSADLARPVVRLLRDAGGRPIPPEEVDLSSLLDLEIDALVSSPSATGAEARATLQNLRRKAQAELHDVVC